MRTDRFSEPERISIDGTRNLIGAGGASITEMPPLHLGERWGGTGSLGRSGWEQEGIHGHGRFVNCHSSCPLALPYERRARKLIPCVMSFRRLKRSPVRQRRTDGR